MHRIRERRRALGMTMKDLGNLVGVSEGAISHYETGRREPDPDMLGKIASALNVSVDYLLCRESPSTADPTPENSERDARRAEAYTLLEQLSEDRYQAILSLLKTMTNKKE